jgi:hypothetical protein
LRLRSHLPRADHGIDFDFLACRSRSPVLPKHEGVA